MLAHSTHGMRNQQRSFKILVPVSGGLQMAARRAGAAADQRGGRRAGGRRACGGLGGGLGDEAGGRGGRRRRWGRGTLGDRLRGDARRCSIRLCRRGNNAESRCSVQRKDCFASTSKVLPNFVRGKHECDLGRSRRRGCPKAVRSEISFLGSILLKFLERSAGQQRFIDYPAKGLKPPNGLGGAAAFGADAGLGENGFSDCSVKLF
jgi:hypothetical protein